MKTGRRNRFFTYWLLPLCLTFCFSCARTPASMSSSAHADWTANAAQLQMLASEVTKPGFTIRFPPDYHEVALPSSANATTQTTEMHSYSWQGTPHPDGSRPLLIIGRIALRDAPDPPIDLHELIAERLPKDTQGIDNVVKSTIEDGSLNGVACARMYWKGTPATAHHRDGSVPIIHGMIYMTWNSGTRTIMAFSGGDADPYYAQTSKELEAAVMTLKPN